MELGNRVIYDQTGRILTQSGEARGDLPSHVEITELHYVDIPYGAIDYSAARLVSINPENGEPVLESIERPQTDAERIKDLEDELLLAAEKETGGIL